MLTDRSQEYDLTSLAHTIHKAMDWMSASTKRSNKQLLKFVDEEQSDWDLYIHVDSTLISYRVSRQDSTKESPFFLMYGCQARLPVEFNSMPAEEDPLQENKKLDLDTHISRMIKI